MREKPKHVKRAPDEYDDLIAKAQQTGNTGWAEYLAERFDRDYPVQEDA